VVREPVEDAARRRAEACHPTRAAHQPTAVRRHRTQAAEHLTGGGAIAQQQYAGNGERRAEQRMRRQVKAGGESWT
jgi:hypothetical protein